MRSLLFAVVFVLSMGPTGFADEPKATAPVSELSKRLLALSSDKSLSYQQLLHHASHDVRSIAVDRPWSEIEAALRKQGLRELHVNHSQYVSIYRYLVAKDGWIAGDKTPLALYVEFMVDMRNIETVEDAKPGFVMVAQAGLNITPIQPYAEALAGGAYPEETVLYRSLRLPDAAEAARKLPILKLLEVEYGVISDHRTAIIEQGFRVHMTFGDSVDKDRPYKSLYFLAPSGLDARQDGQGKSVDRSFESQDTVGSFRQTGSSESK